MTALIIILLVALIWVIGMMILLGIASLVKEADEAMSELINEQEED